MTTVRKLTERDWLASSNHWTRRPIDSVQTTEDNTSSTFPSGSTHWIPERR
jgi:hypothetical protein